MIVRHDLPLKPLSAITNNRTHPPQVNNFDMGGGRVPNPYIKFAMNKKWWVGLPQGEEEGWDMEGRVMTRGRTYTDGRGGEGRGGEGRGGEGRGGEGRGGEGRGGEGRGGEGRGGEGRGGEGRGGEGRGGEGRGGEGRGGEGRGGEGRGGEGRGGEGRGGEGRGGEGLTDEINFAWN